VLTILSTPAVGRSPKATSLMPNARHDSGALFRQDAFGQRGVQPQHIAGRRDHARVEGSPESPFADEGTA
jgi:hypothetical protein